MPHPLLWKELRESRLGLVAALLWLSATVVIYATVLNERAHPPFLMLALGVQFALGAVGTFILLGAGRVLMEQQHGTWDFLRTLPAPLPRVMVSKWIAATALGAGASFLFTAIVMGSFRLAGQPPEAPQGAVWLWAVPACAVLLFAVLALIDAVNWGGWTVARAMLTALAVLGLPSLISHSEGTPSLAAGGACLGLAGLLFAIALHLAVRTQGEPWPPAVLSHLGARRRGRTHFSSQGAAVRWAVRRHGLVASVGLAASPWLVLALMTWLGWTSRSPTLKFEAYSIMVLLALPLAGVCCGGLDQLQMNEQRLEPFARALPVPWVRRSLHRLAVNLTLYAFVAAALALPLLLAGARPQDTTMHADLTSLLVRAALLGLLLVLLTHGLSSAAPRLGLAVAGFLALWVLSTRLVLHAAPLGFTSDHMLFAVIAGMAALAAPWLAWRREV